VTAGSELRRGIASAESSLGRVIDQWDAADLSRGQRCCALLNMAIDELEALQTIAKRRPVADAAELTVQLHRIRSEATRMIRIVDATTAFCRGMAASFGAGESACAEPFGNITSINTQG
jgi:hypothetical protein